MESCDLIVLQLVVNIYERRMARQTIDRMVPLVEDGTTNLIRLESAEIVSALNIANYNRQRLIVIGSW